MKRIGKISHFFAKLTVFLSFMAKLRSLLRLSGERVYCIMHLVVLVLGGLARRREVPVGDVHKLKLLGAVGLVGFGLKIMKWHQYKHSL